MHSRAPRNLFGWFFATVVGASLVVPSGAYAEDLKFDPQAISVPSGYTIEPVVTGLNTPTTAIFDGADLLVAESGFKNTGKPRIVRIKPSGEVQVVASEGLVAPITGLLIVNNTLYVSHLGKISVVEHGVVRDIVTDLPSLGDHQNNKIVLGPDGKIYVGQGTATNSGVVGTDDYEFGWLEKNQQVHDVPCQDVTVYGANYWTDNPLTPNTDHAYTGAYQSFGASTHWGQVIPGNVKCNGAILRFNPDGSGLEVYASGMRNPFGLQFDRDGQLWTTMHGADVRGSRPIYNDPDYLIAVDKGAWYGWPDYFDGGQPANTRRFASPLQPTPRLLLKSHPPVAKPFMTLESHSAANGLAFSPGGAFGYDGQAFVADFGTFASITSGVNVRPAGFKIVRIDLVHKQVSDFITNDTVGPSYVNRQGGLNRPSDVVFGPDQSMYIVDWGGARLTKDGLEITPQSGAVWRVYASNMSALRPNGPVQIKTLEPAGGSPEPLVKNAPPVYEQLLQEWIPIVLIIAIACILIAIALRAMRPPRRRGYYY